MLTLGIVRTSSALPSLNRIFLAARRLQIDFFIIFYLNFFIILRPQADPPSLLPSLDKKLTPNNLSINNIKSLLLGFAVQTTTIERVIHPITRS